jgi:hypothetical protein
MDNELEKSTTKHWVSEGLIIAAIPIVAYMITFSYETGFAGFFGIPREFIALNFTSVFIVAGALLGVLFFLFLLTEIISMVFPPSKDIIYRTSLPFFPLSLMCAALFILYGSYWREWIGSVVVTMLFALFWYGFPLLTQRDKKGYRKKLEADEEAERQVKTPFDHAIRLIGGRKALIIILFLILLLDVSHHAGHAAALKQEEFLVANTSPEMVVLRIYGDHLICAPFDRATKEVQRSFIVLKVADNPQLMLRLEKVGPLRSYSAPNFKSS